MLYKLGLQVIIYNKNACFVEIGSYLGASSAFLASAFKKSEYCKNCRLYCIDTWTNEAMTEEKRDTMSDFINNTKPFSQWIVPVRGWSTEVVNQVMKNAPEINLLFIDGDHSYEACLADWQAYSPFLSKNAVIIMHDIGWAEGVQRVVREEIIPIVCKQGQLPNMWWGWKGK